MFCIVGAKIAEWLPFVWYENTGSALFGLSQSTRVTDRQTDGPIDLSKSAFFEGGGLLWDLISDGRGRRPPTTVDVRKLESLPFRVVYQNIYSALFGFVAKHACDRQTDGRTDRELRLPRPR